MRELERLRTENHELRMRAEQSHGYAEACNQRGVAVAVESMARDSAMQRTLAHESSQLASMNTEVRDANRRALDGSIQADAERAGLIAQASSQIQAAEQKRVLMESEAQLAVTQAEARVNVQQSEAQQAITHLEAHAEAQHQAVVQKVVAETKSQTLGEFNQLKECIARLNAQCEGYQHQVSGLHTEHAEQSAAIAQKEDQLKSLRAIAASSTTEHQLHDKITELSGKNDELHARLLAEMEENAAVKLHNSELESNLRAVLDENTATKSLN